MCVTKNKNKNKNETQNTLRALNPREASQSVSAETSSATFDFNGNFIPIEFVSEVEEVRKRSQRRVSNATLAVAPARGPIHSNLHKCNHRKYGAESFTRTSNRFAALSTEVAEPRYNIVEDGFMAAEQKVIATVVGKTVPKKAHGFLSGSSYTSADLGKPAIEPYTKREAQADQTYSLNVNEQWLRGQRDWDDLEPTSCRVAWRRMKARDRAPGRTCWPVGSELDARSAVLEKCLPQGLYFADLVLHDQDAAQAIVNKVAQIRAHYMHHSAISGWSIDKCMSYGMRVESFDAKPLETMEGYVTVPSQDEVEEWMWQRRANFGSPAIKAKYNVGELLSAQWLDKKGGSSDCHHDLYCKFRYTHGDLPNHEKVEPAQAIDSAPGQALENNSQETPSGEAKAERVVEHPSDNDSDGASDYDDEEYQGAKRIAATIAYGESTLLAREGEREIPVAAPDDIDENVEYIIDSGADFDVMNKKKGVFFAKRFIRKMASAIGVDTAGGSKSINEGLRAQVAFWECPNDLCLLKDSPSLLSLGKRCRSGPFTYVHVEGKRFACFINASERLVVVFPLRGNVPVYSRILERNRTDTEPCGLYDLASNNFREILGVWINGVGQLVIDASGLDNFTPRHEYADDPSISVAHASLMTMALTATARNEPSRSDKGSIGTSKPTSTRCENDLLGRPLSEMMGKRVKYCHWAGDETCPPIWHDATVVGVIHDTRRSWYIRKLNGAIERTDPSLIDFGDVGKEEAQAKDVADKVNVVRDVSDCVDSSSFISIGLRTSMRVTKAV